MKRSGAKETALSLRRLFNCEIKVSRKLNLIQKYVPTCGDRGSNSRRPLSTTLIFVINTEFWPFEFFP